MASYEWGEFQKNLGRNYERFVISEKKKVVALVTVVFYEIPLGFSYAYCPRTPALRKDVLQTQSSVHQVFHLLKLWIEKTNKKVIFLRTEPPIPPDIRIDKKFKILKRYVQPRKNLCIDLTRSEEEILSSFHPTNRANIRKAEKLGVTTKISSTITTEERDAFYKMALDTMERNGGKNAYPPRDYFETMTASFSSFHSKDNLSIEYLFAYVEEKLVSVVMVLYLGNTATYIYGASDSQYLRHKTSAFIHYKAILRAKELGFEVYDIGGIDEKRWDSLTYFKKQFGGTEKEYVGNVDIVLKKASYFLYKILRFIRHK